MSKICGLMKNPNLNICFYSSKTKVEQLKMDVSNNATQDSIENIHDITKTT